MKKLVVSVVVLFVMAHMQAQTLIATSLCPEATANHNQRKIVRDDFMILDFKYMVYVDSVNGESVIKGVTYDPFTEQWNSPEFIVEGHNPTLATSSNGYMNLVFESNDSLPVIMFMSSGDFLEWTPVVTISDPLFGSRLPVADVDASHRLNVLWIQENGNSTESLMYAGIEHDTVFERKYIATKNEIEDIAIANHLQYSVNDLFFAMQFNEDSLQFFRTVDHMSHIQKLYGTRGSQPCITFNSLFYDYINDNIKLLYIDIASQLIEINAFGDDYSDLDSHTLQPGSIDYVCIDDLGPPLGYSYLFKKSGVLYHGFSFGQYPGTWWNTILDTISGNPMNPSIAYKSFNMEFVDFVWMESADVGYNIYYKKDPKVTYLGTVDTEPGKGFSITGYPNPFTETLRITVVPDDEVSLPLVQVYSSNLELVRVLKAESVSAKEYIYKWDGANEEGEKVKAGTYFILCTAGGTKAARKVVFAGN